MAEKDICEQRREEWSKIQTNELRSKGKIGSTQTANMTWIEAECKRKSNLKTERKRCSKVDGKRCPYALKIAEHKLEQEFKKEERLEAQRRTW